MQQMMAMYWWYSLLMIKTTEAVEQPSIPEKSKIMWVTESQPTGAKDALASATETMMVTDVIIESSEPTSTMMMTDLHAKQKDSPNSDSTVTMIDHHTDS